MAPLAFPFRRRSCSLALAGRDDICGDRDMREAGEAIVQRLVTCDLTFEKESLALEERGGLRLALWGA